jgi:hypothetical protein
MRRVIDIVVLVAAGSVAVTFAQSRTNRQEPSNRAIIKPIHENIVEFEHAPPPPTLAAMYQDVDALLSVRVESAVARDRLLSTGTRLVTEYQYRVLEVFKPHANISDNVTVLGTTAEKDRGAYIERQRDPAFPTLNGGERYILLLQRGRVDDAWWVLYGPYGAWNIEGNSIRCVRMSPLCASMAGWDASRLVAELRTLR